MANKHPNKKGLKPPFDKRSPKEARKAGKKGGKASGKARAEKKLMREAFASVLSLDVSRDKVKSQLKQIGIADDDINNQMVIVVSMFNAAANGNVQAATFIRDTMGEAPVKELQVEQVIPTPLMPIKKSDAPDNRQ